VCSSNNMASVTCTSSTCNGACQVGYADCDNNKQTNGCETNIYTSPNNCGACGAACSTNHITAGCTAPGNCSGTCQSGYRDCDNNLRTNGCEIDIMTDPNNCGGCSGGGTWPYVCSGTNAQSRTCTNGVCTTTCLAGYGNCDNSLSQNGCNVYFVNNPNYCGSCSLQCDTSVDPNTGMPIQKCVVNKCLLTNGQPCFVGSSCVSGICSQGLCSPF